MDAKGEHESKEDGDDNSPHGSEAESDHGRACQGEQDDG
jgi:hypothetical protein